MTRNVRLAALAAALLVLLASAFAETPHPETGREFRLSPPADPSSLFRFLPEGQWRPFDRTLVLGAAPGELRRYDLEIRNAEGTVSHSFLVDRLAPRAPLAVPGPGSYQGEIQLRLSAEEGASILYGLSGPGEDFGALRVWDPSAPILLHPRASGTATWILVLLARDAAGNESQPLRLAYELRSGDLGPTPGQAPASPGPPRADPSLDLGQPELETGDSSLVLRLGPPPSGSLVAAVGSGEDGANPSRWFPLELEEGRAVLRLSGPYGWSGSLGVRLGILDDTGIRYLPKALELRLGPRDAAAAPAPPGTPQVLAGAPGAASLLVFPDYEGDILYSLDGGPELLLQGPLTLEPGNKALLLSWRGRSREGLTSASVSLNLPRPSPLPARALLGLDGPLVRSQALSLRPAPGAFVRYELAEGSTPPREVGPSSPLLEGPLSLDAPPSSVKRYQIRYRAFSGRDPGSTAGDEEGASITIDREAPEPPLLGGNLPRFSRTAQNLVLSSTSGDRIFVELEGGEDAPRAREYGGVLRLDAPEGASRTWTFRAWTRDEAGNLSKVIGPYSVAIDPQGLYVDQGAAPGGNGDPDRPFASVEAALASGRFLSPVLHLRSGYRFASPLRLEGGSLSLVGGSASRWLWPESPQRSLVDLPGPRAGLPPVFLAGGASLALSGLELRFPEGEGDALLAEGSNLDIGDCLLSASASGSLNLLSLTGSRLRLSSSRLRLGGRAGGVDLLARDSSLSLANSELGAEGRPAWLSCISAQGGDLSLEGVRLSPRADISAIGLAAEGLSLSADRLLLELGGEAGYGRAAKLSAVRGKMVNSYVVTRGGQGSAALELRDSALSFVHDSFVDQSTAASLVFLARGGNPLLLDSLFVAGGSGRLLDSDRPLEEGSLGACAFAGFASLVSGPRPLGSVAELPPYGGSPGGASLDLGKVSPLRAAPKGGFELLPGSPPVDGGLDAGLPETATDFNGLPRPSAAGRGLPDIGAQELQ